MFGENDKIHATGASSTSTIDYILFKTKNISQTAVENSLLIVKILPCSIEQLKGKAPFL